jgi:membrane protease YdiL (CAAX protease family)
MTTTSSSAHLRPARLLIAAAWALTLLVSDLPNVLSDTVFGVEPGWLFWAKIGVGGAALALCLLWRPLRALWQYALMILIFLIMNALSAWVVGTPWWISRFGGPDVSFTVGYLAFEVRDLIIMAVIIAAIWIIKRRREAFFLAKGQLNAPVGPVRWLGVRAGTPWTTFAPIFIAVVSVGLLIFMIMAVQPTLDAVVRALPLFPVAVLLAALNAITEEMSYRAPLLATSHEVVGAGQALLMTSVFFGLAHFLHGSPNGIPGFLMVGFLAWVMGKSMLETKGVFWAWLIHFVQDVVIYAFFAILFV